MKQSDISAPVVTQGPDRPFWATLRLHVGSLILRNLVWLLTGDGNDYDEILYVPTPGLGDGRVRCVVCRPSRSAGVSKGGQAPLVLVLQGGGFILGQPEDGQKHDRKISDEVTTFAFP